MAWIEETQPRNAEGKLEEVYRKLFGNAEETAHILSVHSLHPESLSSHVQLYKTLMFGKSPLSRPRREMIATVVSQANDCHY